MLYVYKNSVHGWFWVTAKFHGKKFKRHQGEMRLVKRVRYGGIVASMAGVMLKKEVISGTH